MAWLARLIGNAHGHLPSAAHGWRARLATLRHSPERGLAVGAAVTIASLLRQKVTQLAAEGCCLRRADGRGSTPQRGGHSLPAWPRFPRTAPVTPSLSNNYSYPNTGHRQSCRDAPAERTIANELGGAWGARAIRPPGLSGRMA